MTELNVDIRPTKTESGVVYAPFDQGLNVLAQNEMELVSLPQNAELRIQQGKDAYVSQNGNWVREGVIYTPNGKPRLVRNSTIIASAREATEAHRNCKEFYPIKEAIEMALADSTEFPNKNTEIPTNRFDSEALTVYAFGGEQLARKYGEFLREAGINKMPVWAVDKGYVDKQSQPFERKLWFGRLDVDWSDLFGDIRWLDNDNGVRGVRSIASEARAL